MKRIFISLALVVFVMATGLVFNTGFNATLQNDIELNSIITQNDAVEMELMLNEKYKDGGLNQFFYFVNDNINKALHFTIGNDKYSNDLFVKEQIKKISSNS